MADPLSAIASVAGIIAFGGQVLAKLTEYINDIQQAPKHVEELANELMSTTTVLQRFKLLVIDRQSSNSAQLQRWAADSQEMLKNCEETFKQIKLAVEKAQIKSTSHVGGEIVSRVKWVWNKKETELLVVRLKKYETVLQLMLQTLSSSQIDNIDQATQKIHDLVQKIQDERAKIKERLVVLDKDHPRFSNPDGVVSFQALNLPESDSQPSPRTQTAPGSAAVDLNACAQSLKSFTIDIITDSIWNSRHIESLKLSRALDPIDLSYEPQEVKVVFASGISPMLEIQLGESAATCVGKFYEDCKKKTVTVTTPSIGIRRNPEREPAWNATQGFAKAYSELSFWGQLKASPVLLPGLAVSAIIDTAIDRVKDVGIVERSLDIPILQPPHTSTHSLRKMWYPIAFVTILRASPESVIIHQNSASHAFRKAEGSLEIRCSHKAIADEVENKLSKIAENTRAAWLMHTATFAPLLSARQISDSQLEDVAINEEFRWVAFAGAFAKLQPN